MNRIVKRQGSGLLALALVAGLGLALAASAQPFGPGGAGRQAGPFLRALRGGLSTLDLTADQKAKIAPLLKHEAEQMKAVRDDQSLSQDQKKEKAKAIREEGQKAVAAVLTPEQAKKLAEMRPQGPRGDRPRGEHGKGDKPADK